MFVGKNRGTLKLLHCESHGLILYTRQLDGVCFLKSGVDEEKNECVISYATFVKMAIGERLWGSAMPFKTIEIMYLKVLRKHVQIFGYQVNNSLFVYRNRAQNDIEESKYNTIVDRV